MLAAGISFDRIWIAGYLMVCGDLGFVSMVLFSRRGGVNYYVPTSSTYLSSPADT